VYQQTTGITTESKYVVAWDPIGWSVLPLGSSTTCVSSP